MRIIITKTGVIEFTDKHLSPYSSFPTSKNKHPSHFQNQSKHVIRSISNPNILSTQKSTTNTNQFYPISKIKTIKIKQTKLNIPIEKIDQYDKDTSRNISIIKVLHDINSNSNSSLNNSCLNLPVLKKNFSLKEIIHESCLKKLDDKLRQDNYHNTHDIKIDHTHLRKENSFNKRINEIEKGKDKLIHSDNKSLIEYLMGKKTISDKFITSIQSYNDKKMERINKVCQRIVKKKGEDKLDLELQTKILNNRIKMQQECKMNLNKANNDLNSFYSKISETVKNRKLSREEAFGKIHDRFAYKFWKKHNNFKRFFHKNSLSKNNVGSVC